MLIPLNRWLKSYRSYKFPFVGRPAAPPDVYAAVKSGDSLKTIVHVSWNGATEVATWKLYKTTANGKSETSEPVMTAPRFGFETALEINGYATYVVLEGLDADGKSLGRSGAFETVVSTSLPDEVLSNEKQWLDRVSLSGKTTWKSTMTSSNGAASFLGGLAVVVICILAFRVWRRKQGSWWTTKQSRGASYEMVTGQEEAFELADDEEYDHNSLDKPRAPVP